MHLKKVSDLCNSFIYRLLGAAITDKCSCILGEHHFRSTTQDLLFSFVQG